MKLIGFDSVPYGDIVVMLSSLTLKDVLSAFNLYTVF